MNDDPQDTLLDEMEKLGDIFVAVRAELDQRTLTFGELLNLNVGSLLRLSRPTGENIDIYIEDVLIGWGEVLLMDGTMTIRLADLRNGRLPGSQKDDEAASNRDLSQKE
jgi:flagellar motor switch/type III secretory pathway protein FliN